jgi:beta-lactamase class A
MAAENGTVAPMASVFGVALPDGVEWGVCVRDAATGEVLAEAAPDRVLPAASIGKVLLLVAVAGGVDLAEPLTRTPEDAVADSGLWQHLAVDTLPAGDLAALVGAVSDNLATNVLLRRVGLDAVRRAAGELGLRATALHDRVRDERTAEHPPALSTATAGELSAVFAALAGSGGAAAGREVAERVLGWLALGADLSMVAAGLGLDPLAHAEPDRGIRLRHKTGTDRGVRADAGLLEGPAARLAYAVLARFDDARRDAVLAVMRELGAAMQERCQARFLRQIGSATQAVPTRSNPSRP